MPTLEEMIAEAAALGYGEPKALRASYLNWQKRGLLGPPERKANRRGGEGIGIPHNAGFGSPTCANGRSASA